MLSGDKRGRELKKGKILIAALAGMKSELCIFTAAKNVKADPRRTFD